MTAKVDKTSKKCLYCGKTLEIKNFSHNKFCEDEYECYCKKCKKEQIITKESLIQYLKMNNLQFNESNWIKSFNSIKNGELKKYSKLKELPSNIDDIILTKVVNRYFQQGNISGNMEHSKLSKNIKRRNNDDIEISEELMEKWGYGYDPEEYLLFEKKYNRLIRSYSEKTEMHSEALLVYIRYRVKEEVATASGDVRDSKEWGNLAAKAALDAKINPTQISRSDISGGIDVLSQLFEAVESEAGIIPLLPKLLEQPYDDADMIIWCIVNYIRRLEDKPIVCYKDIYNYYDDMLNEYYKQLGYDNEKIEIFLKRRNNVFRDLENIYIEPLYSNSDYNAGGDE